MKIKDLEGCLEGWDGGDRKSANVGYFESHYKDFRRLYPDEFVAVDNGKVVGHEKDFDKLLNRLRVMQDVKLDSVHVDFVYFQEKPDTLILPNYTNLNAA